jgi:hypothetical protein
VWVGVASTERVWEMLPLAVDDAPRFVLTWLLAPDAASGAARALDCEEGPAAEEAAAVIASGVPCWPLVLVLAASLVLSSASSPGQLGQAARDLLVSLAEGNCVACRGNG